MECRACGAEVDPGAVRCPSCAAIVPRTEPPPTATPPPAVPAPPAPSAGTTPPPESTPTPDPQSAPAEYPLPSGNPREDLPAARSLGWNWGGFLIPYFWLLGHGRVSLGLALLLSGSIPFLSFLHLLVYPITAIYLGLNGYELAWRHRAYHSLAQLKDTEREWTAWGVAWAVLVILGVLLLLLYLGVVMEEISRGIEDLGY